MNSFRLARGLALSALACTVIGVLYATLRDWSWWTLAWWQLATIFAWWSHAEANRVREGREIDRRIARGKWRLETFVRGTNNVRVFEAPSVAELIAIWERE